MPSKGLKMRKSKKAVGTNNDIDDITTEADLPKLSKILGKSTVVLGIFVMDGCHYCETIKPILERYKNAPGRKVPIIKINRNMLTKTPLKDAKIDGFPSGVLFSPKDGSFGSFKTEDGQETNAIPNLRDEKSMIKLLQADPRLLQKVANNTIATDDDNNDSESLHPTRNAEALLEASGKKAIKEKDRHVIDMNDPSPPNTSSDSLNNNSATTKMPVKISSGGSLLESIMRYVGGGDANADTVAVASAAPAQTQTKRRKRRQGTRKGARRG